MLLREANEGETCESTCQTSARNEGILEVDQDTIQPGLKPIPAHSYAYANNLTLCLGRERGTRKPSRNGTKESSNSRTEGLDLLRRRHVSRM